MLCFVIIDVLASIASEQGMLHVSTAADHWNNSKVHVMMIIYDGCVSLPVLVFVFHVFLVPNFFESLFCL